MSAGNGLSGVSIVSTDWKVLRCVSFSSAPPPPRAVTTRSPEPGASACCTRPPRSSRAARPELRDFVADLARSLDVPVWSINYLANGGAAKFRGLFVRDEANRNVVRLRPCPHDDCPAGAGHRWAGCYRPQVTRDACVRRTLLAMAEISHQPRPPWRVLFTDRSRHHGALASPPAQGLSALQASQESP